MTDKKKNLQLFFINIKYVPYIQHLAPLQINEPLLLILLLLPVSSQTNHMTNTGTYTDHQ